MIRGAIFDFDGTLFDSMFIWKTAGDVYLRSLGKEPEKELQKKLKTMSLRQSAAYMQRAYSLSASVEEIMEGINHTVENFYFNTVQPKPDVIPFLERMKAQGIKMCIATATDRYQVEAALRRCGMDLFFSDIFTCSDVEHGKDEPVIFRRALEHLQTTKVDTAFLKMRSTHCKRQVTTVLSLLQFMIPTRNGRKNSVGLRISFWTTTHIQIHSGSLLRHK